MHPTASLFVTFGIAGIAVAVALGAVLVHATATARQGGDGPAAARRAALLIAGWMALTFTVAASGLLHRQNLVPPPFLVLFVFTLALGLGLACSKVARQLATGVPLWGLVLFQGYRLPLEVVMHVAGAEGTMPVALSFDGYNFDILTGAAAIALGLALRARALPLAVVHGWNLLGMAALTNIAGIALLSSPLVGHFGPGELNTWVAYPPFVWLPTVLVVAAIAGHGAVLRGILERRDSSRNTSA